MIEHCPTRPSETQPIHQARVPSACQAICDKRRSLGTLLGLGGKPGQAAHRSNIGQIAGQAVDNLWLGAVAA
jgi:hypothetical protein